jgi:hypothetical protein
MLKEQMLHTCQPMRNWTLHSRMSVRMAFHVKSTIHLKYATSYHLLHIMHGSMDSK